MASLCTDARGLLQAALCKGSLQLFPGLYNSEAQPDLLPQQTCRECADVQEVRLSRAAAGGISISNLFLPCALHGGLSERHILKTSSCCCADASAAKAAGRAAEALLTSSLALEATK